MGTGLRARDAHILARRRGRAARGTLVLVLVMLWALRLGWHLLQRNRNVSGVPLLEE
ncbi:MAG TPA: DUF1295 domain-containing protein [Longimicrobiales bacterium]|nr:DUF1295 domain-containing protein [Longimicrobiales bacterium]